MATKTSAPRNSRKTTGLTPISIKLAPGTIEVANQVRAGIGLGGYSEVVRLAAAWGLAAFVKNPKLLKEAGKIDLTKLLD